MKHIKILGLCLVATFAFGAVAASAAFAEREPTFWQCAKAAKVGTKYTGKYTNSSCTKEATTKEIEEGKTNKYELGELSEAGITPKASIAKTTITTKGVTGHAQVVSCKKGKFVGTIGDIPGGNGKLHGTLVLEECEANKLETDKCGTAGKIEYTPNFGETFWLASGETKPGLLLQGGMTFECGGERVEIGGLLIGTAVNAATSVSINWKVTTKHEQEDRDFWSEEFENTEGTHLFSEPGEVETTVAGSLKLLGGVSIKKAA